MKYSILGHPSDGPTLTLDYREFAYAGKFVMSKTGKSVVIGGDKVLGAVAFNADHENPAVGHLRYVSVRDDRQGEGIGSRLLRFTADYLLRESYDAVTIAVNNPVAYRCCYRAGFRFTGEETGIAEIELEYNPTEETSENESSARREDEYLAGLDAFRERNLPPEQRTVLDQGTVPAVVDVPSSTIDPETAALESTAIDPETVTGW